MTRTLHEEYWASAASQPGREPKYEDEHGESRRLLRKVVSLTDGVRTVVDSGAGSGRYVVMLREILPGVAVSATEINGSSVQKLRQMVPPVETYWTSILEGGIPGGPYDLVMAMGLLACVPPDGIERAYESLRAACGRYLLVRDYSREGIAPQDEEWAYGGSSLFQRDYVRELMYRFPNLSLLANEPEVTPGGRDIHWILFERGTR